MKAPKSEWDKKLKEFNELTYEERLEYWINERFYNVHHCRFNSDFAIERMPELKEKIIGGIGEFSIVPETDEQREQYLYFLIDYLPNLTSPQQNYNKTKGFKDRIIDLEARIMEADKPAYLLNKELESIEAIVASYYPSSFENNNLIRGYEDSATGIIKQDFYLQTDTSPEYFYFYGALLSKYEKYIRARLIDLDPNAQKKNSVKSLDSTPFYLLIRIMQECNLFPESSPQKMDVFLGHLINESPGWIAHGRKITPALMLGKINVSQKRQHLPNLLKIRPILNDFGNEALLKRYNEIIERIERIK